MCALLCYVMYDCVSDGVLLSFTIGIFVHIMLFYMK